MEIEWVMRKASLKGVQMDPKLDLKKVLLMVLMTGKL